MPNLGPTIQQDRGCLSYETQVITMPPSESGLLGVSKLEQPGLQECDRQLFTLLPNPPQVSPLLRSLPSSCVPIL